MKKRVVIGLTGGIATGKTSVLRELKRLGIATISSDELAHATLRPGHPVHGRVVQRFGRQVLRSHGRICRTSLGKIVFADPAQRQWLERQIHPAVIRRLKFFIRKHRGLIVLDIPLLFEARLEKMVDDVLVVTAPLSTQLSRMKRRDGLSPAAARRRIRSQLPLSLKTKRADYVLLNRQDLPALNRQVRRWVQRVKREKNIA